MHKITEETIADEILNQYIPPKTILRDKLIRTVNELYQYDKNSYLQYNKGNYKFIKNTVEYHNYIYN